MKIIVLLKSGPFTAEARRAFQLIADMLAQGHSVGLYLLQEAVRFCHPRTEGANTAKLHDLIAKNLEVHVLTPDAELRGIEASTADAAMKDGSYESLVDLMTSCDRVVGIF